MEEVKAAVDNGRDVIFHCASGFYCAPLTASLVFMFGLAIPFGDAQAIIEAARGVELSEVILPSTRPDGTSTEDHRKYLNYWEEWALAGVLFRFLPALGSGGGALV